MLKLYGGSMSLASYAISVTTVMYFLAGFSCFKQKDWSHGGMWISYAFANFFLLLYELNKTKSGNGG